MEGRSNVYTLPNRAQVRGLGGIGDAGNSLGRPDATGRSELVGVGSGDMGSAGVEPVSGAAPGSVSELDGMGAGVHVIDRKLTWRPMRITDVDSVFNLMVGAHDTSWDKRYEGIPINEAKAKQYFAACAWGGGLFSRVLVRGREIGGAFVGSLNTIFFSDAVCAREVFWYIRPELRGSIRNLHVLTEFAAWAKGQGAHHVSASPQTNADAVFKRAGFTPVGRNYWMGIK